MVQPTNKSVIGSNLREDSIKKREFANFKGYTKMDNPAAASLLRLSPDSHGVYTISLPFPPFTFSSPLLWSPATLRFLLHSEAASQKSWRDASFRLVLQNKSSAEPNGCARQQQYHQFTIHDAHVVSQTLHQKN